MFCDFRRRERGNASEPGDSGRAQLAAQAQRCAPQLGRRTATGCWSGNGSPDTPLEGVHSEV
ncbi:hypothetical protein GCM10010251_95910 [Streptomyces aurantiogriseus]|uniref:Uncharacterized protein n=1 Tax=Streptomyces aurantiogriseus TaxID=66870 RepID=A0A918FPT7_9ACTN|nr:hypothetical protein GCM10010251_95910 [Streptomyces aurantiogriseus]